MTDQLPHDDMLRSRVQVVGAGLDLAIGGAEVRVEKRNPDTLALLRERYGDIIAAVSCCGIQQGLAP